MPQVVVRRRQALWHSCATVEADHPHGRRRGAQSREAGSRPGGGVPFLMRCRRMLRTCAELVITAMNFHGFVTTRAG